MSLTYPDSRRRAKNKFTNRVAGERNKLGRHVGSANTIESFEWKLDGFEEGGMLMGNNGGSGGAVCGPTDILKSACVFVFPP